MVDAVKAQRSCASSLDFFTRYFLHLAKPNIFGLGRDPMPYLGVAGIQFFSRHECDLEVFRSEATPTESI